MTPADDAAARKAAFRTRLLARRSARPAPERAAAAAAVTTALLRGLAGVHRLAAFVPDATEPGAGRLPAAYTQLGARVLLPVVPAAGRELSWAVDTGRLAPGRFGLQEPVGPRLGPTAIGTAEVVVVPAVAVSRSGVRLGRGGGYYDRALRHARPGALVVALVFDDELVDDLPAEPHDHRVTAVVTPSGGWEALPAGH
ncbi:5-formyltetrahydrofolate cyclo-ligase [Geodermatophilus sabuli]|uniref:5-formyltetrahydrofolate cyclo-ligase n=1 Tax=Geodermatophilus sabuli TaxID=1564158 RepID=A0A285EFN8_9ACTN|nr:5-formyltetrahydrofolate cyclo-ligase [Geodermatophilus sabuli]MBB3083253.1 5-formyltetrahydrofolate cyclo-ligase [Geodermatophilus sabuli]SNX97024.1 5-formyltetrahydrofolate cyclo-ligase [Geodermatophilus sabuli]